MIDLFLIPFAGGSKYSYNALRSLLPPDIHSRVLEFPGRGARLREPLIYRMEELVQDLAIQMAGTKRPFAIYGHSMGAIAGWLLIHRLQNMIAQRPVCFFASGNDGPSASSNEGVHLKPHNEFAKAMENYGGLSPEILENESLLKFAEPILRADFEAYETYAYKPMETLLCPAFVLSAKGDRTCSPVGLATWQKEFAEPIGAAEIEGDHFFIIHNAGRVSEIVTEELSRQYSNYERYLTAG